MACRRFLENVIRKKPREAWLPDIPLRRCFTTMDLTSLGVGTIVGAGLYVAIGDLARDITGPSIVISVLLASVSAMLCALSFAEYGSRFPDAGSSYIYTYATMGEIWAFVVGWNTAFEFLLIGAGLARKCSELINSASNGKLFLFFTKHLPKHWNVPGKGPFPDLLAAALVLAVVAILCLGARSSTNFHNIVTVVNLLVVTFMIVYGSFFANVKHWTQSFMPHGVKGLLRGAASAFFAFAGFDIVAEAAEEAIEPEKNIPRSLVLIIAISTVAYVGVATVLTLMLPHHTLDVYAPLSGAFQLKGFPGAKYIVIFGGICATISALFCAVYSTSRIIYSMSMDGLLFRWFSKVHAKTQVPGRAIVVSGIITALLALLFEVDQLLELTAIGTLIAYTKVTISVVVSRYQTEVESVPENVQRKRNTTAWLQNLLLNVKRKTNESQSEVPYQPLTKDDDSAGSLHPAPSSPSGVTESTAYHAELAVFFLVASIAGLTVTYTYSFHDIHRGEWKPIFLVCLFAVSVVASLVALRLQPRNSATFPFMVPCVPYTPVLTICINVMLLANLHHKTYIRFGVWMTIGLFIYLLYGYRHSSEAINPKKVEDGDEAVLQETPEIEPSISRPQLQ